MTTAELRWSKFPWPLFLAQILLLCAGLAAIARGDELVGDSGLFSRQLVWVVLAIPATILAVLIPIRFWRGKAYPLFFLTICLLVIPYFMPARGGSHRWIPLGPVNFQPSEVAKLAYMMALAQYLMFRDNYRKLSGLLVPFLITLIPMALILKEPDLGTSLLFLPVLFSMLFAAGARLPHLILIIAMGISSLPVGWGMMSAEQKSRVTTLFSQADGGPAPQGDGYHLHQSKQMLTLGGLRGSSYSGLATDDMYLYHLPASRTDFIFCLIGEHWGLLGCMGLLLIYMILFGQGLHLAAATEEPFSRLLAIGIVTMLCTQLIINTGMTVGLTPITGLTLPLVSYGGSSMLMTSFSLGLLINIAIRPGFEVSGETFRY
ncbi:MAG: rod shape-determining protein RodA [Planctomycetaceae bacterium]|nr:rod shape-determining protein RodA [Planctomycetaceae bacterium]